MGGQQSQEEEVNLQNVDINDYEFLRQVYDPRFGSIKIMENKRTQEEVMVRTSTIKSKGDRDKMIIEYQTRQKLVHFNLQKIYGYICRDDSDICSDIWTISQFNEYISYDLDQEIKKRSEANEYFDENDIWYLIESVSNLGHYLKSNYCYHGDIKPLNIFLTKDGLIKLNDNGIITNTNKAYDKAISRLDKGFLSPQLLNALSKNDPQPLYDEEKADIFGLGMTVLQTASLINVQKCYDWEKFCLHDTMIENMLNTVRSRYSEALYTAIKFMINPIEVERCDFFALKSFNYSKLDRRSVTVNYRKNEPSRAYQQIVSLTSESQSQNLKQSQLKTNTENQNENSASKSIPRNNRKIF